MNRINKTAMKTTNTHLSPPSTVVVASLQASSDLGSVEANTAKFTALAIEAANKGAKILVLPETAITGYLSQDLKTNWITPERKALGLKKFRGELDPATAAQPKDGPIVQHFCDLAKKLGVYITVPFLEVAERAIEASEEEEREEEEQPRLERVYYNSVSLAAPSGEVVAHYRKNSPWPTPEQSWATAGNEVAYADTEYGRVGLAICFDIHSVLVKYDRFRLWALLYPIAWVGKPKEWFHNKLPSLLKQCNVPHYIIGCNWSTDKAYVWPGAGFSTHYGPKGEILATTSDSVWSTIVYSTLPVHTSRSDERPEASNGRLNLDKYASWTRTGGEQAKEWRWF
ncbi:Carbon-nitrogen hydrolase [Seminavis robusta]|uniref:Carbon-nitrogen hydrolase n=1 Tax=Seminavis robusta TaxID=568900 RepID=A0A9N8EAR6_9STRA|nr:Carbon-nitrogen hydrolase [Seminavis robusta]|eukprot:Sro853_g211070.1 Carbon-nitrogen hydrolase (341) ;mRNA; f:3516-4538